MNPTISLTRSWRPEALLDRAGGWRMLSDDLHTRTADYRSAVGEVGAAWAGEASEAARVMAGAIVQRVDALATGLRHVADAAEDAHFRVAAGRVAVLDAVATAEGDGFEISEYGAARASAALRSIATASSDPSALAVLHEREMRWSTDIVTALARLANIDLSAAALLRRAADLLPVPAPMPPIGATPEDRRRWWESLSSGQQHTLLGEQPALIGGLDGLPTRVRDEANRARLDDLRARWESTLAAHRSTLTDLDARDSGGAEGPVTMVARREVLDRIAEAQLRLLDLDAVRANLAGDDRLLLLLDTDSGAQTRAAMAIGDPDSADHVSVTTGGITTTVRDSLNGMVSEGEQLREEAITQLRAADRGTESVAVIAWLGYDAPQIADGGPGVVDILTREHAERGAVDLNGFFRGLDAANGERDANVSAFGHSYGSLTTSLALQHDPSHGVDAAVFYGSPGVAAADGETITDRLGVDEVHEMTAHRDPVAHIPWFGTNPSDLPDVERLSTDPVVTPDGVARDGADGHSDYARPGSNGELRVTGYNLAAVLADTGNEIPHRAPGWWST